MVKLKRISEIKQIKEGRRIRRRILCFIQQIWGKEKKEHALIKRRRDLGEI